MPRLRGQSYRGDLIMNRAARKKFPTIVKPKVTYSHCAKCGKKIDGLICAACATAYKEWVERNCAMPGGKEEG